MAEESEKPVKRHKNFKEFLKEWRNRPRQPPPPYTGFWNHARFVFKRDRPPVKELAVWMVFGTVVFAAYQFWSGDRAKPMQDTTKIQDPAMTAESEKREKEFMEFLGLTADDKS